MKHSTFTLGAVTGMTALLLGIPVLAQVTGAQDAPETTTVSSAPATGPWQHRTLTTEDIQAMIDHDDAFLDNADAIVALHKSATQAHRDALAAALTITDAAERQTAIRAANEAMRTTIQDAIAANPDLKDAMPFGGHGFRHGNAMRGPGPYLSMLAQELGMTEEELQKELDSGKTLQDIATEKGIDLPTAPPFPFMGGMHRGR